MIRYHQLRRMNLYRITLSLAFLLISNCNLAQKSSSIASTVNRVYKYDAGFKDYKNIKGAIEIKYDTPFRIRQKNSYPEITEVYNLDTLWRIPQCQRYASMDSCHEGNLIFTFELWTQNDTITLEYLHKNTVIESKEYILQMGEWPISSNVNLIEDLLVREVKANHTFREYQSIDHFSIYISKPNTDNQIAKTGYIRTDIEKLQIDTINIKTLSTMAITPLKWAARGYAHPEQYGVTSLYYGMTDSIEFQETWKSLPIEGMTIRNIFIENNVIQLLTSKGLYLIENDSIIQDYSFKIDVEYRNSATFHGLFKHNGQTAIVYNKDILIKNKNEWKSIYQFKDIYKYECSILSIAEDSIYFVADRKFWFTNLDTTIQIRPDISNIMSLSEGPDNSILYKQGRNNDNCAHGGIYFIDTGKNVPLKREYISEYPDLTINDIFFMVKTNRIIVTSYTGIYEFELEKWLRKR